MEEDALEGVAYQAFEIYGRNSTYKAFGLRQNYATTFLGSPAYRWQIMGLLSLYNHLHIIFYWFQGVRKEKG